LMDYDVVHSDVGYACLELSVSTPIVTVHGAARSNDSLDYGKKCDSVSPVDDFKCRTM
jgi:hypothetical protein